MTAHHEHDLGLAHDLPILVNRRRALAALATGVGAVMVGCGSSNAPATSGAAGTTATGTAAAGAATIAEETAGPFPGNGSNGPDVLGESGVVRRDITRSIGGATGVAAGVATTLRMRLIDVAGGGGPLAGAAVYAWHCDQQGRYSLYEDPVTGENYLRGVQASDAQGTLEFRTIFPGAYAGRWPHVHFEVYESLDAATTAQTKLRTSQVALPKAACEAAFATAGYEQSVQNLSELTLEGDAVFADGYASQLATASGSATEGFTLSLNVGV